MKNAKNIICKILASTFLLSLLFSNTSYAITPQEAEMIPILTTAYYYGNVTASGCKAREGIAAGKREWLGKTLMAWERNQDGSIGEFLGYWEILDTGFGADSDGDGIGSIQEGKVIDMYFENLDRCKSWMKQTNGKLYIKVFDAEG